MMPKDQQRLGGIRALQIGHIDILLSRTAAGQPRYDRANP